MRILRHKGGYRRSDPDRRSFAFFAVGALVIVAAVFLLGLQAGRVVEKNAARERAEKGPADNVAAGVRASDVRKEMSVFSEEAVRIPAVPPPAVVPPTAGEELRNSEAAATFPDSLSRRDPSPQPLVKPKRKEKPVPAPEGKFLLQAGAMKNRETAEAVRNRIRRAGYKSILVHAITRKRGEVFRVRVGPFGSREEAGKAMKKIRTEMKIDVILLTGEVKP
ncbi:MAG: SPOR domain-containing protein [Deltaproteobacteria bacterium]|nr:MAG: SPOR domain-containing protein [Deltaproteobacteria bacterium]